MDTTMLFTAALQLVDPWHVTDVEFRDTDAGGREPRITIGYGPAPVSTVPRRDAGRRLARYVTRWNARGVT